MRRKKVKRDAFEQYHRKALLSELLGIALAVASASAIVGLLVLFVKHFPKG